MGIQFVKGKVARITEDEEHNPIVRVELVEDTPRILENRHDLVVLSVGLRPAFDPGPLLSLDTAADGFVLQPSPNIHPCVTDHSGVFAAGAASGPMDIVDSITMASAAAAEAAGYLEDLYQRQPGLRASSAQEREVVHA